MKVLTLLLVCFMYSTLLTGQASPVYRIASEFEGTNSEQERYNDLYDYTQILEDPTGEWIYEEVLGKADQFGPNTTHTDRDLAKVYWVQLRLQPAEFGRHLFSAGYLYDEYARVDIYYERGDSLHHQVSGYQRKAAEKTVRRSGSYFWIDLAADTIISLYLRVDNQSWYADKVERHPISIFHIEGYATAGKPAAYILPDFAQKSSDSYALDIDEMITDYYPNRVVEKRWLLRPKRVKALGRYFEFYPDPDCKADLETVRRDWDQKAYFRGYTRYEFDIDTCYWARLRVINPKPFPQTRTFAYTYCRWDRIDYFLPGPDGAYQRYEAFPNIHNQEAFSFTVPALDTFFLYIRYPYHSNPYGLNGSIMDIHAEDLYRSQQMIRYKYLLAGAMLFFLVYFFIQMIVNRQKVHFYYWLLLLGLTPFLLASLNLTPIFEYTRNIYHVSRAWHWGSLALGRTLATIGFLKFTQIILDIKTHLPRYNHLIKYIITVECIQGLVGIEVGIWFANLPYSTAEDTFRSFQKFQDTFYGILMLFVLFLAMKSYLKKAPLSGSYLIAILPLAVGILNNNIVRRYIFPDTPVFLIFIVCMLLSLMLYSILVGSQFNLMQLKESRAAQQSTNLQNQLLQIESKALRAQMNPHFIFNCLNSIKSLIQDQANKQAVHYLTLFSKFIRQVLHHSEEKQISLEEELEMSRLYIEMEKLRFGKAFTYKVEVNPAVDTSFFRVPPMILQPFLENAIWHGLMHKEGEREIRLEIRPDGEGVKCIVEDNGIGRERASTLNLNRQHQHRSFGTRLILDRLKVNKELFNSHFLVNIIDKMTNGQATGTRVELSLGG